MYSIGVNGKVREEGLLKVTNTVSSVSVSEDWVSKEEREEA
jgi:hypothetical protein